MDFKNKLLSWLIYLYIIVIPFAPEKLKYKGLSIPGDCILLIIVLVYIYKVISNKQNRTNFINALWDFYHDGLSISMLILLFMMFISVSYSTEKGLALNESLRFLSYLMLYFVIKYGINDRKLIKNILNSYIILTTILGIMGIIQYFTGFGLNKKFISDYKFGAKIRIAATLDNPNSYAAFLILIIFPLIILAIAEKNKIKKILYSFISLLVLVNIVFTGSRNALLAFIIGCIILSIIYNWKSIYILIISGVISLFIPQVSKRIMEISDPTENLSRIKLWATAFKMIKEHPLLGVGNGNFVSLYDSYVKKYPELLYPDYHRMPSHNSYLKVESELGIIGIISFLGIIIFSISKMIKYIRIEKENFYNLFFKGFLASVIAFLFMNISDNLFFVPKVTTYFWIIVAVSQSLFYTMKITEV